MSNKNKSFSHGIYLYTTKEEIEIARLKVINENNPFPSLLILNEPKRGHHRHYFLDSETGKIRGHIKNEETGKRREIKETFRTFRNKKIKTMLK